EVDSKDHTVAASTSGTTCPTTGRYTTMRDSTLLAPRVFGTPARVPRIGVIPHLSHRGSEWVERLRADNRIEVIDVRRSPHTVCRQIGACMAIITSSLHGLIVADAYGVPAVWGLPTPILLGSDHKFRDHHTAIGLDPSDRFVDLETTTVDDALDRALTPDDSKIVVVQDLLEEGLRGLHQELSTERRE
ncbi:polysaccharide pyruvyl transferase family protein, partial [Micrococcus luteus]|uniref:polysaccharide pyruvyl transferase family protein n=1 Tax=Micrococcus luteus TaxID=1270 RepID=UPI0037224004